MTALPNQKILIFLDDHAGGDRLPGEGEIRMIFNDDIKAISKIDIAAKKSLIF